MLTTLTKSVAVLAAAVLGATLGLAARGVDAALAHVPVPATRAVGPAQHGPAPLLVTATPAAVPDVTPGTTVLRGAEVPPTS